MNEHERELARERKRRQRRRERGEEIDTWRMLHPGSGNLPIGLARDLRIPVPRDGLKIAVIPDVQAMPGVPLEHLRWCGQYLAAKQPDVIVCIGDFGDFPSLSKFLHPGSIEAEGQRYGKDLQAFHNAMARLMIPINNATRRCEWDPYLEFCLGNHEDHIRRTVNENPKLEGLMSLDDLQLNAYGWRVHEFLQPINIGGVAFCHYFPSGIMGKPISSASVLLKRLHLSAFAGHQQGRDIAYSRRADGGHMTAIITGSFYQHSYAYLSPFTNSHWRGMFMLHEVRDGQFDEMAVSINFLKRKFA